MHSIIPLVAWASTWSTVWNPFKAQAPKLVHLMDVIGLILVVVGIGGFIWQKRRNASGGNPAALAGALLVGLMFSGPDVLFPLLLKLADAVVNGAVAALK